ncbi:MAG: helix-turn-helix transcriptional regulator [Monoglobaceae bacterium]
MNGLKYIRTRCNYSQRALAEVLGVSRQAVNMWENSKKIPSKERKKDLCLIFGIDNPDYLGELTDELLQKLKELPVYKIHFEGDSERFAFKPIESEDFRYQCKYSTKYIDEQLSLDEKCTLKRLELKTLLDDINNYAIEGNIKNSFNNLSGMNRALQIFGRALDAAKEARNKHPEYVMVYYYTIIAVLDAVNISFGNINESDVLNQNIIEEQKTWYDYREFSVDLSKFITNHIDSICNDIPTKRKNPHDNYRRRIQKSN